MNRILGVDYGTSNIGLALGIGGIVQPYKILPNIPNHIVERDAVSKIIKIVALEGIDTIVVGIPQRNGEDVGHSKAIRKFAQKLQNQLKDSVEIKFIDESSTSKESISIALDAAVSQKRRKADHSIAAGLIIKRWWEAQESV